MNKMIIYAFVGAGAFSIVGGLMFISPKDGKLAQANLSQAVVQQEQPQAQPATSGKSGGAVTAADIDNSKKTKEQQAIDARDRETNRIFKPEGTNWMWEAEGIPWYVSLNEDGSTSVWNYHGYGPVAGRWTMSEGTIYINDKEGSRTIRVEDRKRSGFDYYDHSLYFIVDGKEYLMEKI